MPVSRGHRAPEGQAPELPEGLGRLVPPEFLAAGGGEPLEPFRAVALPGQLVAWGDPAEPAVEGRGHPCAGHAATAGGPARGACGPARRPAGWRPPCGSSSTATRSNAHGGAIPTRSCGRPMGCFQPNSSDHRRCSGASRASSPLSPRRRRAAFPPLGLDAGARIHSGCLDGLLDVTDEHVRALQPDRHPNHPRNDAGALPLLRR